MTIRLVPALVAFAGLAACADAAAVGRGAAGASYDGIETRMLDAELVNFRVVVRGGDRETVTDYAACAAAQYALIRGYGFARHLRTSVAQEGSIWRGDAVYTISPALPRGAAAIDAEVTVRDCLRRGVPTV
jgi:hypothetical protein